MDVEKIWTKIGAAAAADVDVGGDGGAVAKEKSRFTSKATSNFELFGPRQVLESKSAKTEKFGKR